MDKQRWQQIKTIFDEASDKSDDSRKAFLQKVRHEDQELSQEIESLLDASQKSQEFLAFPATLEMEGSPQSTASPGAPKSPRGKIPPVLRQKWVRFLIVALVLVLVLAGIWLW